jgi:hypothetical protein
MNQHNPERDLLFKENWKITVRLLLANAFQYTDSSLTAVMQGLFQDCPDLFSSILPRSEQMALADDGDGTNRRQVLGDTKHIWPLAIGAINVSYSRNTLRLPSRAVEASPEFLQLLSRSYGSDFGMPNIVAFRGSTFHWCTKLSFSDPLVKLHRHKCDFDG